MRVLSHLPLKQTTSISYLQHLFPRFHTFGSNDQDYVSIIIYTADIWPHMSSKVVSRMIDCTTLNTLVEGEFKTLHDQNHEP